MDIKEFLTTKELAKVLKVDIQTVRRWARENSIPSIKIQTKSLPEYRFKLQDVIDHFKNADNKIDK